MPTVSVFGFGSYFRGDDTARDIDLLIVHDNLSNESCALAIRCRRYLSEMVGNAHITILSKTEEEHFDFLTTSRARKLGAICSDRVEGDVVAICRQHIQSSNL